MRGHQRPHGRFGDRDVSSGLAHARVLDSSRVVRGSTPSRHPFRMDWSEVCTLRAFRPQESSDLTPSKSFPDPSSGPDPPRMRARPL
jgi:hypothetical protein